MCHQFRCDIYTIKNNGDEIYNTMKTTVPNINVDTSSPAQRYIQIKKAILMLNIEKIISKQIAL